MNPVRSGFRAVLRQPAVIAGEIAWRWTFGAAAWALLFLTLRDIFAGVDVSEAEYYLARHSDAFLIADAWARVLIQVLPQLARAALILIPAFTLIWIVAATVGRVATLRALGADLAAAGGGCRHSILGNAQVSPGDGAVAYHGGSIMRLLMLNVLRAVFTLATVTAFFGTVILVSRLWPQPAEPVIAALVWLLLAGLVGFFWSVVNWFLGLAPIFIVRDGRGVLASIGDALALHRHTRGSYSATAFWFGLLRTLTLIAAFLLAIFAAAASSSRAGMVLSVLVALIYFAVADFLYIARLAAFLALAAAPAEPLVETAVEN